MRSGTLNVPGLVGMGEALSDWLMMELKDLAVASGSACSSAKPKPSHVLLALGLSPEEAKCSLRFGLGRWTTELWRDAPRQGDLLRHFVLGLNSPLAGKKRFSASTFSWTAVGGLIRPWP